MPTPPTPPPTVPADPPATALPPAGAAGRWRAVARFGRHRAGVLALAWLLLAGVAALLAPWLNAAVGVSPTAQRLSARLLPAGARVAQTDDEREAAFRHWLKGMTLWERWFNNWPGDRAVQAGGLFMDVENGMGRTVPWDGEAGQSNADALVDAWFRFCQPPERDVLRPAFFKNHYTRTLLALYDRQTWHPLGTDELGRDEWARLLCAARVSLGIGLLVALTAGLTGLFIGCVAGYYGGWLDSALMRTTDALLALPTVPVLILLAAANLAALPLAGRWLGAGDGSLVKLVFILWIFSWMPIARVVRSSVLVARQQQYVDAARVLGRSGPVIILRHVLPNITGPFLVAVTLCVGHAILAEAALGFLGFGVQPPTPSWGNMLNQAKQLLQDAPWLALYPGLLLSLTVVSINFLGDALQSALNPRTGVSAR